MSDFNLIMGDCLEQLKLMPDNSIDSIVTDPPYGISFMGKKWDYQVPSQEVFAEMLRVLKPGGHALVACGTRTQHRMAVNIEDAGFEIRDVITWLYGSGFPKSMDISKAIDKQAGADRPDAIKGGHMGAAGRSHGSDYANDADLEIENKIPAVIGKGFLTRGTPQTESAKQWQGWGTALKPACEFWTLARKPISEKTVAANVLEHGTGGINIDRCRIGTSDSISSTLNQNTRGHLIGSGGSKKERDTVYHQSPLGRWPANLILDEEAAEALDEQSGTSKPKPSRSGPKGGNKGALPNFGGSSADAIEYWPEDQGGGASRFFYVAKASKGERNHGLDEFEPSKTNDGRKKEIDNAYQRGGTERLNTHPTVKPIKLMTYLCRLITPPNGIVLDPFMGSGSTGVAAIKEGFGFVGIEREPQYFEIAKARINEA